MYNQFVYFEDNNILYDEKKATNYSNKLLTGYYELVYIEYPLYKVAIRKLDIKNKSSIIHNNSSYIYDIIDKFNDIECIDKLKKNNIDNRFGILLYGDAGCGKTSIINDIIYKLKDDCLIFNIRDKKSENLLFCWEFIQNIRQNHHNNIIIIFDEFDEYISSECDIKQIMDGQYSIDNCLFLTSTNYIDNIPDTIKNRPSRIKYKIKIEGIYDINTIKNILINLDFNKEELEKTINLLKGKTLDEIKNYCIDYILNLKKFEIKSNIIGFKK